MQRKHIKTAPCGTVLILFIHINIGTLTVAPKPHNFETSQELKQHICHDQDCEKINIPVLTIYQKNLKFEALYIVLLS